MDHRHRSCLNFLPVRARSRFPLFLARFVIFTLAVPATAQPEEGFMGYAWGTPLDAISRTVELTLIAGDGCRAQYSTGIRTLEGIPVTMCDFEFVDGRFSGVIVMSHDTTNSHRLLRFLPQRYGAGFTDSPRGWQWMTAETHVSYDEGSDGTGYLYVYALRFAGK